MTPGPPVRVCVTPSCQVNTGVPRVMGGQDPFPAAVQLTRSAALVITEYQGSRDDNGSARASVPVYRKQALAHGRLGGNWAREKDPPIPNHNSAAQAILHAP